MMKLQDSPDLSLAMDESSAPRVLHVDGDHDTALVLAALLVPETRVSHAASLADALEAIRQHRFALIVLDPDLPDGDGHALVQAMQKQGAGTPVLLYSARHPDLRHPSHAFLPKPWTSPRLLWQTVSHLLGLQSADWLGAPA
ncbi:response regulator [Massilia sp. YIM B04103]|uniref:response regulator n=1 Tax=Massilia sp. YIM B04103 TaxID=2963106 RepID=UPI00210E62F0|nr:response regulator [Massilia sp. YIM B04103]